MTEHETALVAELAATIATTAIAEIILPKLDDLTTEVGLTPWYKDEKGAVMRVPSRIRDIERLAEELYDRMKRVEAAVAALAAAYESSFDPDLRIGGAA